MDEQEAAKMADSGGTDPDEGERDRPDSEEATDLDELFAGREAAIEAKQEAQWNRYLAASFPAPGAMYRMGNDELMHHVHLFALQRILEERLGVTQREVTLVMNEIMYEECEKIYEEARRKRREALTQGITSPVNPII